ncbi:MAG TPA: glycoside hydrolase family 15 protein [Terracidiphilus sp.]|jgi:hypothetical protein
MHTFRFAAPALCVLLSASFASAASRLVTGNGFGFAVVAPDTGTVTSFYTHPYSFVRPDPAKPLGEGIQTTNLLKSLGLDDTTAASPSAEYQDDSHVIHIRNNKGEGQAFMPFGLKHAALIVVWDPAESDAHRVGLRLQTKYRIKQTNHLKVRSRCLCREDDLGVQQIAFDGVDETMLVVTLSTLNQDDPAHRSYGWAYISLDKGEDARAVLAEFDRWAGNLSPRALVRRELDDLDRWRVKPNVHFTSDAERHLWRQSEVMLRIAQSREPNRPGRYGNGFIVASLPDGVWSTPWVRDTAWATVALARMGHKDEARAALLAYFNARPTGKMRAQTANADYQVSVVRYFGNGAEEPWFTEEGSTNIEFDDWGEVLWALGQYLKKYDDPTLLQTPTYRGSLYKSARDFIVHPLEANMEKHGDGLIVDEDTSIWEEHQKDKKHFAFSTAMAIIGLREFAGIARHTGDKAAQQDALDHVAKLQRGFDSAFIRDGKLRGTLEEGEKNDIDGALLGIINFGVVTDRAIIDDVVSRMELLKVASGGYRRVRSNYTDPAIFEYWYERQEFLFVDFSLAELERHLGREADSAAQLKRIVDKSAADHDILPEMYVALPCKLFPGAIGDPTGAIPMVGYGAGEYLLHLLDREEDRQH